MRYGRIARLPWPCSVSPPRPPTIAFDASGHATSASAGASVGSLTATQTMTYDALGSLATADGPLPGSADTVRYRSMERAN